MSNFWKSQTVHRYSGGYWDSNGEWNAGSYEEMTIMASVQPLNVQETQQNVDMMPEGGVEYSAVKIYSNTPLYTDKQALPDGTPLQEADVLVWGGRIWKVVNREDWQSGVISHYRMVAWEINPDRVPEPEPDDEEVEPDGTDDAEVST